MRTFTKMAIAILGFSQEFADWEINQLNKTRTCIIDEYMTIRPSERTKKLIAEVIRVN